MADLRSYVFLDSLQPQHAAFLGTVAQGFLPLPGDASLWVEIAPGIEINRITDVAVKATSVRPGMQIIERLYGMLEVHSPSQADVLAAGAAILEALGLKEEDRWKPRILSSQVIHNVDPHHAQLINRMRHGTLLLATPEPVRAGGGAGGLRGDRRQRGREARPRQHPRGARVRVVRPHLPGRRGARRDRRRRGPRPLPSRR